MFATVVWCGAASSVPRRNYSCTTAHPIKSRRMAATNSSPDHGQRVVWRPTMARLGDLPVRRRTITNLTNNATDDTGPQIAATRCLGR